MTQQVYELASMLINECGHVVIGTEFDCYEIGQIVHRLWGVPVDQPIRIIGKATVAEARKQGSLALERFGLTYLNKCRFARNNEPHEWAGKFYWKAITD